MIPDIETQRGTLAHLCRKHRVARLEVFGSATAGHFDAVASDLDFLAEFEPMSPTEHSDAYFGLQEDLEALFGRPVDVVEPSSIRNPYFLEGIDHSRVLVYAASD
jgi:hypothetical protein